MHAKYLFVSLALAAIMIQAGPVRSAEIPEFVKWPYDGAYQQSNGLRGAIILNAWWRWKAADTNDQALPVEGWAYRKVPGSGSILGADGKPIKADPKPGSCWVEREFNLPADWKDRDIALVFDSIDAEIFIDGAPAGCAWGGRSYMAPVPKPYRFDKPYRLTLKTGGVNGDIWLKAWPAAAYRIQEAYLTTSVRNMNATIRAHGAGPADVKARVIITAYQKPGQVVRTVGPLELKSADNGWSLDHTFDWKDPQLWTLEHPNLYEYFLELVNAQGQVVDRIFPIRFGFREVWIQGGSFMLNNRRITITSDEQTSLPNNYADEDTWRKILRWYKQFGVCCLPLYTWSGIVDDTILRLADEEGFFIGIALNDLKCPPAFKDIPDYQGYMEDSMIAVIRKCRHSPCVPFYYLPGAHNSWDFQPSKLGESYDIEQLFGLNVEAERALAARVDPARFSFSYSGGGSRDPVHASMNYIHLDADLQTHVTWPSHWYREQKKPLATYEMGAPPYIASWFRRSSRGEHANGVRGNLAFYQEFGAIYLGEEAYQLDSAADIDRWLEGTEKGGGWPYGLSSRVYLKVGEMFMGEVFRAYKTYGVNMGLFLQTRDCHDGDALTIPPPKLDPRRPGEVPDAPISLNPIKLGQPLNVMGLAAARALSPVLAYLGGPDGEFTLKDHAYSVGENIRKAVVLLNDHDDPVTFSGSWQLCATDGRVVTQGVLPETKLAGGELAPDRVRIELKAPDVKERTDFVLKLAAKATREGSLDDTFPITVFPSAKKLELPAEIKTMLFDPVGDTRRLLEKAGVPFEMLGANLPRPEGRLLIVGRNALKDKANNVKLGALQDSMGYGLAVSIGQGLRVLVFEQAVDNLWGLKTEQTRWRQSFIRAPGHLVLSGLQDQDFHYLKGHSDLVDPYPPAPLPTANRVAESRFPEWGNDNVVVTYALRKPQKGAARALVDCGFDLQEAAVLEVAAGKGRMIFCQVDVTGRYGTDPVSTRLVNNLLSYIASVPPPDPTVGEPIDLIRKGDEEYDIKLVKEKTYRVDKSEGPLSWGISAADLYFGGGTREGVPRQLDLSLIQTPEGKKLLYYQPPNSKVCLHALNLKNFRTGWQKMKALTMRAALLINQGGSSDIYPNPSLHDEGEELYPQEWKEGFVDPYWMMLW